MTTAVRKPPFGSISDYPEQEWFVRLRHRES
jgi:hypothetical protein